MVVELSQEIEMETDNVKDVHVIILKVNNPAFSGQEASYNLPILGKPMIEWVINAVNDFTYSVVSAGTATDIFSAVSPHLQKSRITVVLFSDTPLLTKSSVLEAIDYFQVKHLKICKLPRGYILDTDYFKSANKFYTPQEFNQNETEFYPATSYTALNQITAMLKSRINNFHMSAGVHLVEASQITIGPDVVIGKNVVIHPGNQILGETVIGDGVELMENNIITSSVILTNATVCNSIVKNSVISENVMVMPFCCITNKSTVGKNSLIELYCKLNNAYIEEGTEVKPYTNLTKE